MAQYGTRTTYLDARISSLSPVPISSHIIHDWGEEQCLTILGHCRRAMSPASRVLIIEMGLPAGNVPHTGKMLDMMVLVGPCGQKRTEPEYRTLLSKVGRCLTRVVSTNSAVSVVEAMIA